MESSCWKEDLLLTHFKEENEFVTMVNTTTALGEPYEVLAIVSTLKEIGNSYFKYGKFGLANDHYDRAAKHLSCLLMMSDVDPDVCKDLAVSLHLNLVACALKLGSFHTVLELCSVVLSINPDSTNARFGRAKTALGVGLTATSYEDLTKALSSDPKNSKIKNESRKVALLFKIEIRGKRKLDNRDHLEGNRDCSLSRESDLDSPCVVQGRKHPDMGMQVFPCEYASTVVAKKLCGAASGVPFVSVTPSRSNQENNASDASSHKVAAPLSTMLTGCPMEVDTKVEEVSFPSSNATFKDGSHSSSCKPIHAELKYWFVNRQRNGSIIKVSKSSYQALMQGKAITYSCQSQYSSLSIRIKKLQTTTRTLNEETTSFSISDSIPEPNGCLLRTTTSENDIFEVVEDNACLMTDYARKNTPTAFTLTTTPSKEHPTLLNVKKT